jgi:hypothetical protein
LTFPAARAILRDLMHRLAVPFVALCAAALAACGNPCQDLGDRLCSCVGSGTAKDTCKQQIKNQISAAGLTGEAKALCAARLDTCHEPAQPANVQFCEWINTTCGKASCGLSTDDPALVCTTTTAPAASFQPAP